MMPSTGHLTPTYAKALIIDDGASRAAFVTIDAIGADSSIREMALRIAITKGLKNIDENNFSVHGSHSHSGEKYKDRKKKRKEKLKVDASSLWETKVNQKEPK